MDVIARHVLKYIQVYSRGKRADVLSCDYISLGSLQSAFWHHSYEVMIYREGDSGVDLMQRITTLSVLFCNFLPVWRDSPEHMREDKG